MNGLSQCHWNTILTCQEWPSCLGHCPESGDQTYTSRMYAKNCEICGFDLEVVLQLSADCLDLLDRIFVVDEKKRISIQEMKKHCWYNKPLPLRLQHSERHRLEQQQKLEAHIATRKLDEVRGCDSGCYSWNTARQSLLRNPLR